MVADDIVNGLQCEWCGICFEDEHGYPVLCEDCWNDATPGERKGHTKATLPEC